MKYTDIRQICPGGFVLLKTCMRLEKEEQLPFLPLPVILHNFMKPPAIYDFRYLYVALLQKDAWKKEGLIFGL